MVFRRKTRKFGRITRPTVAYRYRYNAKGRRYKRTSFIPVGLPDKTLTKMRMYVEFPLDPGVRPSVVAKEFRMTSLFDFDASIGGLQPTPFDQMCTFYKRFRVLGAKCIMRNLTCNDGGASIYGMIIQPTTGLTAALTINDLLQSENVSHNYKLAGSDNSNRQSDNVVKYYFSLKKYYSKAALTDDDYTCTALADPAKFPVLSCFACGTDPSGAVNPPTAYYGLWVEFIVQCTAPNINASS